MKPPCRVDAMPADLRREADRSVLYGACLKLIRPQTRLKREIAGAADALLGPIQAFFEGREDDSAAFARDYAIACGAADFLEAKRAEYQARQATPGGGGDM